MQSSLLLIISVLPLAVYPQYQHPPSLVGKTPCCLDRLSTATCVRMRQSTPYKFMNRCTTDADFAMIQCCSTCFDRRLTNSSKLYTETVLRQLKSTITAPCWDRRGTQWCTKLVQNENYEEPSREGFWDSPRFNQMGCGIFPFAFRECRHSCGYCSSGNHISRIRYHHSIATDPKLCDIKTYFARSAEELLIVNAKRKFEFDPLALLKLSHKKRPDDYFVVSEHNYEDLAVSSKEDSREMTVASGSAEEATSN